MRRTTPTPGRAYRAVEKLATFAPEAEATAALPGTPERQSDIPYVYRQRRGESYPAPKEVYPAAPGGGPDDGPLTVCLS